MPLTTLIDHAPLHARPFLGLGVQSDIYIYNQVNQACGVTEQDFEMIANRIRQLRPPIVRIFVELAWFEEANGEDALGLPTAKALVRHLRLFAETKTLINFVLFRPMPWETSDLETAVRRVVEVLADLIQREGCSHIRWLTLWNEPDNLFGHGSPLSQRLFAPSPSTWSEYVRLNRMAYQLLAENELSESVKLIVADTVWGPVMRKERMELAFAAFQDLEVAYSMHSYSHEKEIGNLQNPDFLYRGIEEEVRGYRNLLGPERELALWEFNTSGVTGFGTYFAGVGPHGEERIGSIEGAAEVADKVISGLLGGLDGTALWCLHDMQYGESTNTPLMNFGLWRFKWQNWFPRPIYHYYGALMAAFRPGARLHRVVSLAPGAKAIAARYDDGEVVAFINREKHRQNISLPRSGKARLLRIAPSRLPAVADLPLHLTASAEPLNATSSLDLEPWELALVITGRESLSPLVTRL